MNRVRCLPDSHTLQELAIGRVMASRINDVVARPSTKRHRGYLKLLNRQIRGYGDTDPNDQYRERERLPAVLAGYRTRHGIEPERGWFIVSSEYPMIGAAPDAMTPEYGLTVHIRQSEESYETAVSNSVNIQAMRAAQAVMAVTGMKNWVSVEYWEDRGERKRRMSETVFNRNPMADELLIRLAYFYTQAVQLHIMDGRQTG